MFPMDMFLNCNFSLKNDDAMMWSKMTVTFDAMIFLIWGRPFLESAFKYLSNGI